MFVFVHKKTSPNKTLKMSGAAAPVAAATSASVDAVGTLSGGILDGVWPFLQDKLGSKPLNVLVPTALFALLTPGMFVSVGPAVPGFISFPTFEWDMLWVVLVHALIFAGVYAVLRSMYSEYY